METEGSLSYLRVLHYPNPEPLESTPLYLTTDADSHAKFNGHPFSISEMKREVESRSAVSSNFYVHFMYFVQRTHKKFREKSHCG
jgi:hypothetical protein